MFYRDGLFYTKNGLFSPMVLSTLHPVLKSYSRWDTSLKGLSKVGKQLKSDKIVVYTLNKNLFRVNKQFFSQTYNYFIILKFGIDFLHTVQ